MTTHTHTLPSLPGDVLRDVEWLATLEHEQWERRLRAMREAGIPINAGDDDDVDDADDEDEPAAAKTGKGGKAKPKGAAASTDDAEDDDEDEADDEAATLMQMRKGLGKLRNENKALKKAQADAETKAAKDANKWQELYEAEVAAREKLEADYEQTKRTRLAESALAKAKAISPSRAARMLDLDEIEDESDAEAAVRALQKSDPYLFPKTSTRQKRGAGRSRDDDRDDDDDKPNRPKQRVDRLRAGLSAATTT